MAKPRHRKHKKQQIKLRRPDVFFESLPVSATPPALPELQRQLTSGGEMLLRYAQIAASWLGRHGRMTGRWLAIATVTAGPELAEARDEFEKLVRFLARIARLLAKWAGLAAQRIRRDILAVLAFLRWLRWLVWNPRSRALYVAIIAAGLLTAVTISATFAAATLSLYSGNLASPNALIDKKKTGTTILDRNGQVLFEGYGAQHMPVVPLGEIPQNLKTATLAAEDPEFYNHPGFSWRGTARAAWVDLTHGGKIEGGSTLTQQLVKTTLLSSNKTFERKFQELLLATELEHRYTKDQILEMYLNEIDYGQGSNGVGAAAETYFHKSVKDLTLGESALLAGLPLGPSRFDPNSDLQAATDRRNFVLNRMVDLGKISRAQASEAMAQPIQAHAKTVTIQAPHFVFYVLDQLRQIYGKDMVENGGLTVQTTLDLKEQQTGEQVVKAQIANLASHHATNGGLIAMEPSTGDILAMVGSVGYDTPGFGAVNITTAQLQPGSSFKPIAYATAFTKGWNGSTTVDDTPMQFTNPDGSRYVPQDYDGKWRGKVTLRRSLANSLNIPAIRVIQFAGMDNTINMAHAMGITSLNDRNRYGVSLVLGGGEVRPIDMATVYGVFANGGTKVTARSILKVSDRYDKDITKGQGGSKQAVLDPRYSYMITNILSDNPARTEEFGPNSPLKLSRPAAAKTGTTNDFRDNWTVGYTPGLVTAVWVGNNDHSPMSNVDGITGAAPIWHNFMEAVLAGTPVQDFTPPSGVVSLKVCSGDGGLAGAGDPSAYDEVFPADQPLTRRCAAAPPPSPSSSPRSSSSPDQPSPSSLPSFSPPDTPPPIKPPKWWQQLNPPQPSTSNP